MIANFIAYPLLFQFALAIVLMFFWRDTRIQRRVSVGGSIIALTLAGSLFAQVWQSGTQTFQAGGWQAPFGITLVVDMLSATLVLLTCILGLAISIFSSASIISERAKFGYFPIYHLLLMGLIGAFITGDIFNLYVWFEVIIISSFVLLTIGGEKPQIESAVKYFTLNILASVIFLTAIAVLYGLTGTLNMADLSVKIAASENKALINITALIFFVGFGIKSAVFPLYFWLPSSYHTPPAAVSAIFGGLLTKVGVYAMIRVFTLIFIRDAFIDMLLVTIAVLTILTGGWGALVQNNIQKVFSYLIICHIGFMLAGLGMNSQLALTGAIFYMIHDIVVKGNLFMVGGLIYKIKGSNSMKDLGGFYGSYPKLSILMLIPLFSLVGIPPLSGFWPKISLLKAGFENNYYLLIIFLLLGSFLTLFVVAKMWTLVFWKASTGIPRRANFRYFGDLKYFDKMNMVIPIALLAIVSLYFGLFAEHIQLLSERIAFELTNTESYIEAVLGKVQTTTPLP
jgi:multicomponent Na+:H+ antiporter subunit D